MSNSGRVCGLGDAEGILITAPGVPRPRACILVKKSVHSFNLCRFSSQDVVAVHIQIPAGRSGGGMEFVACSAYFPGDKTAEVSKESERTNLLLQEEKSTAGDRMRRQRPQLGMGKHGHQLQSSNYLSNWMSKWRVSSEPSCSDHRQFQFEIIVGERTLLQYKYPKCTDWEGYNRSLVGLLEPTIAKVRDRDEIEIAAEQLRCVIITAYSENCRPLKTKKDNRKSSWWNNKLDKRRKEVRQLFNRAKVSGNSETYRMTLTEYNKEIRRAKRVLEKVLRESGRSTTKH
ncbi:uncharacterized protein LOC115889582 [Sitophilus oryzae]|uniref:Uncharacterized protein LOC115889582 n=1 Tax=Sitophilus oryzae TaxID=7048 RepID=A0A6J2YRT3_SITOR|nr:uncharacterized protein LOC115889582 [Sitophilus oryzae]